MAMTSNTKQTDGSASNQKLNSNIFAGLKKTRDLTQYGLMRGVTDFANLSQFDLYEGGYAYLVVLGIPVFMQWLKKSCDSYDDLIDTFVYILEYEFKSLDGIENITGESQPISDGINELQIINKVTRNVSLTINMRYQEKSGSLMTRFLELYLRGIKDPLSQVKTYYGLIPSGTIPNGFENEVFQFMYIVTDNTAFQIERAFYFACAQPYESNWSIYETEKGNYDFKEVTVPMKTFAVTGKEVYAEAKSLVTEIYNSTVWNEIDQNFYGVKDATRYLTRNHITHDQGKGDYKISKDRPDTIGYKDSSTHHVTSKS